MAKSRKAAKGPVVVVEEPLVPEVPSAVVAVPVVAVAAPKVDHEVEELKKQGWRSVVRNPDGSIDCR